MATIDRLDIQIEGSAQKANDAIDTLIDKLGKLAGSLNINTSGLEKIGKSLNFSGVDKAAKNIQSQTRNAAKSVETSMKRISDSVKRSNEELSKISTVNISDSGLKNIIDRVNGLIQAGVTNTKAYTDSLKELNNYASKIGVKISTVGEEEAVKKIRELKDRFEKTGMDFKFTGNFEQLNAEIEKAYSELDSFLVKEREMISAGKVNTSDFEQLQESIARVGNKILILEDLKDKTEQFEQSLKKLQIPPINTDNLNVLQRELANIEKKYAELRVELANKITMGKISANVDDKGFRDLREKMYLAEKTAEALRGKIKQVQQASTQTSTGAKKLGDSVKSASKSFSNLASSSAKAIKPLNNLGNSFKSLLRTILPILGIRQLFNWGKQAMEISSDLTEVQNVVDTTFGDMAYKVEEFAETSIEKFGMSELALKQISSRFQAMGTAMGFPIDKMSDMSVELTGLAADMASFYNVSQEDVAKSLESIFTGTTRPMRQYGIDLTQATLQEWALKNGLDANVQSMSQAEKTMLRYQYVLSQSAAAQGDFARTSGRLCAA